MLRRELIQLVHRPVISIESCDHTGISTPDFSYVVIAVRLPMKDFDGKTIGKEKYPALALFDSHDPELNIVCSRHWLSSRHNIVFFIYAAYLDAHNREELAFGFTAKCFELFASILSFSSIQ